MVEDCNVQNFSYNDLTRVSVLRQVLSMKTVFFPPSFDNSENELILQK